MHSDHSLQIHLRIPVRVVDDDDVSCGQIDTETSCSGAQHEQKLQAVGLVEGVDGDLRRWEECYRLIYLCLFITELFSHDRRPIHNYDGEITAGVKAKTNPEPELFSEGWGVAGVDTYTGLFGEQTHKQKTFENDFPWNYQINKLIKQNGTNKVLHMQRTQWLWQL